MVEQLVAEGSANREQNEAHEHVADAARGDVEHDHEHGEEERRAAQIPLEDDDEQAHAPHDEHGREHAQARQREGTHLVRGGAQQLAVLGQIGREEDGDEHLGDLAGLKGERAHANPQLGAVDLGAHEGGQQQQGHARDANRVLVLGEAVEVGDEREHAHHRGDRHEEPDHLARCVLGGKARHEGDADAREHEDDGQDGRVCAGGKHAHADVRRDEGHDETDGHGERGEVKLGPGVHHVHGVEEQHRDGTRAQQEQLGRAPGTSDCMCHVTRLPVRSAAARPRGPRLPTRFQPSRPCSPTGRRTRPSGPSPAPPRSGWRRRLRCCGPCRRFRP